MKLEIALNETEIGAINLAAMMSHNAAEKYLETHPDEDVAKHNTYNDYVCMEEVLNKIYYAYRNRLDLKTEMIEESKHNVRKKGKARTMSRSSYMSLWHMYEMMKDLFLALLKQAEDDSEESYEKMISWIRHIPENAPFRFNNDEQGCFNFAVMQSVPVEDEDALE
ncbi:MAG: hypothetical protein ACLSHV_04180 [Hominisplanchenecus sp.]